MALTKEEARRRNNQATRDRYHWYVEHGICPSCGHVYAEPGSVYCAMCHKRIEAGRERKDPGRVKRNAYNRDRKARLIEMGLCTWCGKREAVEGQRLCPVCRKTSRESKEKWNIKQRIQREIDRAKAEAKEANR